MVSHISVLLCTVDMSNSGHGKEQIEERMPANHNYIKNFHISVIQPTTFSKICWTTAYSTKQPICQFFPLHPPSLTVRGSVTVCLEQAIGALVSLPIKSHIKSFTTINDRCE